MLNPHLLNKLQPNQSPYLMMVKVLGPQGMRDFIDSLSDTEALLFKYDYDLHARRAQRQPYGIWDTWIVLGGRGLGKTWTGAQQVNQWAQELGPGGHIALVAKDPADARDVMIEGRESGILACAPPWFRPTYSPSLRLVEWPNGCIAHTYSSEVPDDLRGPQHHKAWGDEPCKWKYAQATWDNLEFGLRLGNNPQTILTTTPRPIPFLIDLLKEPGTKVTTGSTFENQVNLSPKFIKKIIRKYEGTRLGRQEVYAEMLTDVKGALWTLAQLEALRVRPAKGELAPVPMEYLVIGVDPNAASGQDVMSLHEAEDDEGGAECGIVVGGRGMDKHLYVLGDYSDVLSPNGWGTRSVSHYAALKADRIVGETNNGGDMVEFVVRTAAKDAGVDVVFKKVTASRGKRTRAEPIAALYEQGRAHHVGMFADLEDQMCTWVPGMKSPDRMDALVWMATEAMLGTDNEEWTIQ
jgi:phage terminase large subunit-like protein